MAWYPSRRICETGFDGIYFQLSDNYFELLCFDTLLLIHLSMAFK